MATETADFQINVHAGPAQKALDDVRNRALGLGGGLDRVVGGLDRIGGKSGADAEKAVRSLSFALGTAGGRGAEALSVLGDIAGALSGGGLALGLTAAAAAGTYAWTKYQEALADIASSGTAVDDQLKRIMANFSDASNARLASAAASTKQLADAVATFGKSQQQLAVENVLAKQVEAQERLNKLLLESNRLENAGRVPDRAVISSLNDKIAKATAENAQLDREVRDARANFDKFGGLVAGKKRGDEAVAAAQKQREDERRIAEASFADVTDMLAGVLDNRRKLEDDEARAREALRKQDEDFALNHAEALKTIEADRKEYALQLVRDEVAEKEELRRQEAEQLRGYASTAIGIGTSATQQLIDALITGQDHATEAFIANVARQTGSALIGYGTQTAAAGLVAGFNASAPLAAFPPLAIAAFAAASAPGLGQGAAMIGAGLAMGGIGAGLANSFAGASPGSGTALGAARDPGASFGSSASSGERNAPAPVTIQIQYGVGPAPEKMARDLGRVLGYAQAHRIGPRGTR
jgi:hypothetical protein